MSSSPGGPVREIRYLQGNVWQVYFSDWYDYTDGLTFDLPLKFIGSTDKVPGVSWSRMCKQAAMLEVDDSVFVNDVPENCRIMQGTLSEIILPLNSPQTLRQYTTVSKKYDSDHFSRFFQNQGDHEFF